MKKISPDINFLTNVLYLAGLIFGFVILAYDQPEINLKWFFGPPGFALATAIIFGYYMVFRQFFEEIEKKEITKFEKFIFPTLFVAGLIFAYTDYEVLFGWFLTK